jgi:hypothetical protein
MSKERPDSKQRPKSKERPTSKLYKRQYPQTDRQRAARSLLAKKAQTLDHQRYRQITKLEDLL